MVVNKISGSNSSVEAVASHSKGTFQGRKVVPQKGHSADQAVNAGHKCSSATLLFLVGIILVGVGAAALGGAANLAHLSQGAMLGMTITGGVLATASFASCAWVNHFLQNHEI